MVRVLAIVVLILSGAESVFAQLPTATILGEVKDASGAVVAGAKVTARNTDTAQVRTTTTGEDGSYRIDALPVGNYEITTEKEGFKTEVQSGLTLAVAQQASVNFTIQVGQTSQSISVTAEAPLVNTTSSALGGLVDDQRIVDLPLNGRNYVNLTLLQPGVTQQLNRGALGLSGTVFSSSGAPIRSNGYLLDGAILQSLGAANAASVVGNTLGVDGIREYRVITANFNAEYGMSMGSQMVMVSKSGTNQFHGDAFEFLRNSTLDARNYFDLPPSSIGHRLPEFRRNNYGGAFGGPIKRDKTFFFGVYEGLSQALGTTNTAIVPPAGCHGASSAVITSTQCPGLGQASVTIAPQMAPLLALYPLPNLGGGAAATTYGYAFNQPTSEKYGQLRFDQTLSASDNLFVRYTVDRADQTLLSSFQFTTPEISRAQFLTVAEDHIFSPSLLNSVRFSFSRTNLVLQLGDTNGPTPSGQQYSFVSGQPVGAFTVNGFTANGTASGPQQEKQNIFTWSDDLVYTRNRHSLKFGFTVNHYQWYTENFGPIKGNLSFANLASFLTAQILQYTEDPPGSILNRYFHFNTMGFYVQDDFRVNQRLTLNLGMRYEPTTTLQEIRGDSASIHNLLTDATTTIGAPFRNPSLRNFSPRLGFAWDVRGNGRTAIRGGFAVLYDLTTIGNSMYTATAFTPPFDPSVLVNKGTFTIPFTLPANAGVTNTYRGPVWEMNQPHLLSYNVSAERQLPGLMALTIAYVGSRGINLLQNKEANPSLPNGIPSNGLCTNPPAGTVINQASQLDGQATSCFLAGASANPIMRRNRNWGPLLPNTPAGGDSFYNGMQVGLNKRLSKGLELQGAYTWSKVIDTGSAAFLNDSNGATSYTGIDNLHERTDRGPSDFDVTNNLRVNTIYHFPKFASSKGFLDKVENGWWTSGIVSVQSGYPMEVFLGANRSQTGESGGGGQLIERADVLPGRFNSNITQGVSAGCGTGLTRAQGGTAIAPGTPLGTAALWFDPCAYYIQAQGFLGNEPPMALRGPGFSDIDFSLVKDTAVGFLGEAGSIEFRAEIFNLVNHPNFAIPSSAGATVYAGTCGSSLASCGPNSAANPQNPSAGAGILTATNGSSRQIQFGLKILF